MSVLEKKGKGILDDTIPLSCRIDSFVTRDGHTEFVLRVQRGPNPENSWEVLHRYNDFVALNQTLMCNNAGYELPLPPKKTFGNMDSTFLHERRGGLLQFLKVILRYSFFCHHICVKKFLDPNNYSDESELCREQQAAMFVRSEPSWQQHANLKDIGWRIRKRYFLVKSQRMEKDTKYLLSWIEHGPDMFADLENNLDPLLKQLTLLQHPFIEPVIYTSSSDKASSVVRHFHPKGSLRDLIFKAKPENTKLKKYGNLKTVVNIQLTDMKKIGRQVLEALKFLHDKGWPYGHLHAGNVLYDGEAIKLLDIENSVLGLSSIYRSHMLTVKAVKTMKDVDVYCFGHFLYELVYKTPLDSPYIDRALDNCPPLIKSILDSILSSSALDDRMPTIEELISNPFFADVGVKMNEKPSFKISKFRDVLLQCSGAIENRLREDQRKIRQFQRLSKARSEVLCDEEKAKRRKSSKRKSLPNGSSNQSVSEMKDQSQSSSDLTDIKESVEAQPKPTTAVTSEETNVPEPSEGKQALLSSISSFSKGKLKSAETNDRSAPKTL